MTIGSIAKPLGFLLGVQQTQRLTKPRFGEQSDEATGIAQRLQRHLTLDDHGSPHRQVEVSVVPLSTFEKPNTEPMKNLAYLRFLQQHGILEQRFAPYVNDTSAIGLHVKAKGTPVSVKGTPDETIQALFQTNLEVNQRLGSLGARPQNGLQFLTYDGKRVIMDIGILPPDYRPGGGKAPSATS